MITVLIKSLPPTSKYSALDSLFAFDSERHCALAIQKYLLKNGVYYIDVVGFFCVCTRLKDMHAFALVWLQ